VTGDARAARLAENEATFRDANETIDKRADELEFEDPVPFLCECGDPSCHEIVRLRREEYAAVRSEPADFLILPAHEEVATAAGSTIERHEHYIVVRKEGVAGEVAERRAPAADPRQ
jgi:hypothetical protein